MPELESGNSGLGCFPLAVLLTRHVQAPFTSLLSLSVGIYKKNRVRISPSASQPRKILNI